MPRSPIEYRAIHKAADFIEPRMAARFERAAAKMRATVSINDLAMRIEAKDIRGAMRLLPKNVVDESLSPVATTVRDAVFKGGRIGAENLERALKR